MALQPPGEEVVVESNGSHSTTGKTVQSALALLQSLRPQITHILQGGTSAKVRLDTLDVLKLDRNRNRNAGVNAHVLFLGPSVRPDDDEGSRLLALCSKYMILQMLWCDIHDYHRPDKPILQRRRIRHRDKTSQGGCRPSYICRIVTTAYI